jgi:hypothetical protein
MKRAPSPPRRAAPWRLALGIGGVALTVVVLSWLWDRSLHSALGGGPTPRATAVAQIVLSGKGTQTTEPFHLTGGTYRTTWSAWGQAPEFPPCTHSAALMVVDTANGAGGSDHVTDLATRVSVPATGASDQRDVAGLKAGDYYLDVRSACAWKISLSPT